MPFVYELTHPSLPLLRGSFYSNFVRVAYQLAPETTLAYYSFNTAWCPLAGCFCCECPGSANRLAQLIQRGWAREPMQLGVRTFAGTLRLRHSGPFKEQFMKPGSSDPVVPSGVPWLASNQHADWMDKCKQYNTLLQ